MRPGAVDGLYDPGAAMTTTAWLPRVLFVTNRLDRGGAERHLSMVLPDLRAQGVQAELFVLERGGELEAATAAAGVPVYGPVKSANSARHLLTASTSLLWHLRITRPDIVHFFLPKPYLLGSLMAMVAGCQTRFMSRRSLSNYQLKHPWLARLERWIHRGTSVLLGNSQAVVDELVLEAGSPSRVGLIRNGVIVPAETDVEAWRKLRLSLALSDDALVVAIVANLIPYKGHADLLNALGAIGGRLPQNWRLLIIGRDEGIGASLKAQAKSLGIGDHILWLGERSDASDLWNAADLGVLASHEEGFSNALLEGMAAGVPMVATAVGGNLDAIVDSESGRLVPPSDSVAMGQALLALALDAGLRQTMGRNARQRVETQFSQAACIERYLRLYRGIGELRVQSVQSLIDGAAPSR